MKPLPPRDSWIRLAPGKSIMMDGPVSQEWAEKIIRLRTIRGNILAFAFEVEHSIDILIGRFFFPSGDKQSEKLKQIFEELFLKSPSASFGRKIQLFRRLCKQSIFSGLISSDLLGNLERARDLRNRFAHYPISFESSTGSTTEHLTAFLECLDKEILLDENYFIEVNKLMMSVQTELNTLVGTFGIQP